MENRRPKQWAVERWRDGDGLNGKEKRASAVGSVLGEDMNQGLSLFEAVKSKISSTELA